MHRVQRIGIELEAFVMTPEGNPISGEYWTQFHLPLGEIKPDAGIGLTEFITTPKPTVSEAVSELKALLAYAQNNLVRFDPFRPEEMNGADEWTQNPVYATICDALRQEVGHIGVRAVNRVTNVAATHINISGAFNPVGNDGLFVANMLRLAGPHIAAYVHSKIGAGQGHLAIWKDFALQSRLPQWGRWLPTINDYKAFFEGRPRLIGMNENGYVPYPPGEKQQLGNSSDHCHCWDFVRLKPSTANSWYMEVRILPSMHPDQVLEYGGTIIAIIEDILKWFSYVNEGAVVPSLDASASAFTYVHELWGDIFPATPPTKEQWEASLVA